MLLGKHSIEVKLTFDSWYPLARIGANGNSSRKSVVSYCRCKKDRFDENGPRMIKGGPRSPNDLWKLNRYPMEFEGVDHGFFYSVIKQKLINTEKEKRYNTPLSQFAQREKDKRGNTPCTEIIFYYATMM
ncbi:hypothetical protein L2E82_16816 [Cichorium intybus]|uniref:Uncharacterized protein n=1 Tax=Cichorium intybus TaxID=13427 RepID=A0ACB9F785_CICIN|nr:hypothetical protein L2E82_16816 [Cichorium intybus]